jgi:dihydroxyacid dehydratase/phosphogluconate dehydratase
MVVFWRLAWFCCRACYTRSFDGGGIALVKNGDTITIDAVKNTINLKISDEEFASRKANWVQPESKIKKRSIIKIYQVSFKCIWMCNR